MADFCAQDSASPGRHQPTSLREALLFEKWSSTLRVCLMADFCAHAPLVAAVGARASCVGAEKQQKKRQKAKIVYCKARISPGGRKHGETKNQKTESGG